MKKPGCLGIFGLLLILGAITSLAKDPIGGPILLGAVIVIAVFWYLISKGKMPGGIVTGDAARRESLADQLEELSENIPFSGPLPIALASDEIPIYQLHGVNLIESRSNGSSYSGGSQGFSFRVMKGVSYRVGANRGQLQRNPDSLQVVDNGVATFTSKRVIFAGQSASREWKLDSILNIDNTGNGAQVMIAVKNRMKTSGLAAENRDDILPGLLFAIAADCFNGGIEAAKHRCQVTAQAFRALNSGTSEEDATAMANSAFTKTEPSASPMPVAASTSKKPTKTSSGELVFKPGDEEFETVGESFYAQEYEKIRVAQKLNFGDTAQFTFDLVAEPFNKFSKNGHAVAVQLNGVTLAHISEDENTDFFELLKQYNGRGKCAGEIYFAPQEEVAKNSLTLFCITPPEAQ